MSIQADAKALHTLTGLLDKATDKNETHPSPAILKAIRDFCKESDANIPFVAKVLLHRLSDDHPQTRLHVVNLADQLFHRSKAFRANLTASFTQFLELSLGFKQDKPLPGPAAVANQLRQRSLEVVEQWNDKFGSTYKQVSLGYNYLKHNMAMRFPEVRARAAAAEAEAQDRQARSQALLQDKYHQICEGFDGHIADMQATVTQVHLRACKSLLLQAEGFAILEGGPTQSQAPGSIGMTAEEDIAWEAVDSQAAPAETLSAAEGVASEEGLAAYAMDTVPEDLLQQATASGSNDASASQHPKLDVAAADPAVIEMLQGMQKLVSSRHLPRLQEWLKIFVKADVGTPGSAQHAQRERMLRLSLAMQSHLTASKQRLQSLGQQLADLNKATAPFETHVNASSHHSPPRAVSQAQAGLMDDLFGSDDDNSLEGGAKTVSAKSVPLARSLNSALAQPVASADNAAVAQKHAKSATQDLPSLRKGSFSSASLVQMPSQSRALSSEQKQQVPVDPAAPKRSISFSSSIRRKQSGAKQRAQAFNDAADAAIAEAAATARLQAAQTNATDLASQPMDVQHVPVSHSPSAATASHTPLITGPHGTQQNPQHLQHNLDDPCDLTAPVATPVQSGDPHDARGIPGGVQTAGQLSLQSEATDLLKQMHASSSERLHSSPAASSQLPIATAAATAAALQEEEPVSTITRPAKAEVAPKLKVGSRLAANMAKLAASRKANSNAVAPPALSAGGPAKQDVASQQTAVKEDGKKSMIPEDIKRKLLAKAPVVAHGNDLDYWDVDNARALVNARGMEYQNHWGAHDPDVELPSEQLNAFFGTRAEYWTPSSKPKTASGHPQLPPGHSRPSLGHSEGPQSGHKQAVSGASAKRQHAAPGVNAAARSAEGQAVASAASAAPSTAGVNQVRAQRAADRAHNEAVLASTDEQVAQALADQERQAASKAANEKKRKPQPSVRERLAKKLLSGRARGATLGEIESAADARFQEVNSNQWKATRFP